MVQNRERWVAAFLLLSCIGCRSAPTPRVAEASSPIAPPSLPERPSFEYVPLRDTAKETKATPGSREDATRSYEFSQEVYAVGHVIPQSGILGNRSIVSKGLKAVGSIFASGGSNVPAAPLGPIAPVVVQPGDARPNGERIELEAQFAIAVKAPREAAKWVRDLVASSNGQVAKDSESSSGTDDARIELLVRVPSSRFDAFAERLAQAGKVQSRSVKAVDAAPEERDLQLMVDNLDAAIDRYKALLAKATTTADALVAEREIERASSDRDRIKARLAWLRDRIARATVAIALAAPPKPRESGDDDSVESASMHIGVRPLALFDIRESGTDTYGGGGFSFRLRGHGRGRGFPIEVDMVRACCGSEPARSRSGFLAQTGWDVWTRNFESARHRWLLPYAGVRLGIAMLQDRPDLLAGVVAGIDVFRSNSVSIGAQARGLLLVGNPNGPHFAIQPALTAELGF